MTVPIALRLELEERIITIDCTVVVPESDADEWVVRCAGLQLRTAAMLLASALSAMRTAIATWLINSRLMLAVLAEES